MIKRYNISKPNNYMKDGVEKTQWINVGVLVEITKNDGSIARIIEIPAIGLKANVFEIKPKIEEGTDEAPKQDSSDIY